MSDLFSFAYDQEGGSKQKPLAARMRPKSIQEVIGQSHILAPGMLLRRAIEAERGDFTTIQTQAAARDR